MSEGRPQLTLWHQKVGKIVARKCMDRKTRKKPLLIYVEKNNEIERGLLGTA